VNSDELARPEVALAQRSTLEGEVDRSEGLGGGAAGDMDIEFLAAILDQPFLIK
jgi:hypothetical protein